MSATGLAETWQGSFLAASLSIQERSEPGQNVIDDAVALLSALHLLTPESAVLGGQCKSRNQPSSITCALEPLPVSVCVVLKEFHAGERIVELTAFQRSVKCFARSTPARADVNDDGFLWGRCEHPLNFSSNVARG